MKNKSEIVGFQKAKASKNTTTGKINQPPDTVNPVETEGVKQEDGKDAQRELERRRDQSGKFTGALIISLLGSLLSPLSSLSAFFSILLLFSTKKIEQSNRLLGQTIQAEALVRVEKILRESLADDIIELYRASDEAFSEIDNNWLDYLLTLRGGVSFAICIRTIVPPADDSLQSRIYLDHRKKLLSYRKGKSSKRFFQYDPIGCLTGAVNHLLTSHPDLSERPPTMIAVMGEPLIVKTERTPTFVQTLDEAEYLCVDDVFVVGESQLMNLIRTISRKKLQEKVEKS